MTAVLLNALVLGLIEYLSLSGPFMFKEQRVSQGNYEKVRIGTSFSDVVRVFGPGEPFGKRAAVYARYNSRRVVLGQMDGEWIPRPDDYELQPTRWAFCGRDVLVLVRIDKNGFVTDRAIYVFEPILLFECIKRRLLPLMGALEGSPTR